MEKQNTTNQPNQIKRNPTRFNTNVNQGKKNENKYDEQTDVDRSGTDTPSSDEDAGFSSREETKQTDDQIEKGNQQGSQISQQP